MKTILDKIQQLHKMIENNNVDLSEIQSEQFEVTPFEELGETSYHLAIYNVDVNEMIQLSVQQRFEKKLEYHNGQVPTFYTLDWQVMDKLMVTFWSKKNQEPKVTINSSIRNKLFT